MLCRREEHARALNEQGLTVSGRHAFTSRVVAATDPAELPEPELAIVATKAHGARLGGRAARGPLAGHRGDDRPERARSRGGLSRAGASSPRSRS